WLARSRVRKHASWEPALNPRPRLHYRRFGAPLRRGGRFAPWVARIHPIRDARRGSNGRLSRLGWPILPGGAECNILTAVTDRTARLAVLFEPLDRRRVGCVADHLRQKLRIPIHHVGATGGAMVLQRFVEP